MLLERDRELDLMADLLAEVGPAGGKVVLLRGEAGIGKSSLVGEFAEAHADEAHVHLGSCDDLLTPQPLGPFWDIARDESSLADPLEKGDRPGVLRATLDLLSRSLRPTVIVIEDSHWADEATLDAIKYLGRRIARTNGLLVITYRDGQVDHDHPLRAVIGEIAPHNLVRMHLDRLSPPAVASMVDDTELVLEDVLALTAGNPLFVTEVLASGVENVPSSVQDSVLARAAKLSTGARRLLDLVSVIPGESERAVIDDIIDSSGQYLAECVRQGLLRAEDDVVSFPHELTRRSIESSLSTADRRRLNQQILAELSGRVDTSRLVHHAREANDVEAIIEFAPEAARAAAAIESHREALAHFRTLEPYLGRIPGADRAAILDDWARVAFYLDSAGSLDILNLAIELHRSLGDDRALARALAFATQVNEVNGRPEEAEACSAEAVAILEAYPPSSDLAFALSQQAWLMLMQGDDDLRGVELADEAIATAEQIGDALTVTRALMFKGTISHSSTDRTAVSLVEEAHRRAEAGGYRFEEVYALINMAGLAADVREVERAADLAQRARDTAARYENRNSEIYAQAMYSEILLWKGDWVAAENAASEVLGSHPHAEIIAWRILGTLLARRGRPQARASLDRMWDLAETSREMQNLDPAASAMAEYIWLSGNDDPEQIARIRDVLERGMRSGFVWPSGALAFWSWKLGMLSTIPDGLSAFYGLIIEGEYRAAADFWKARGVPYEQALALMHGEQADQVRAIRIFEDLGATAAANRVRRALVEKGVRVPRGKSRASRDHAAGLTARQAEVLGLLAEGLTNAEIADRLFVSYRTVENHVAAILMRLDAPSRDAAVDAAVDRGILAAP